MRFVFALILLLVTSPAFAQESLDHLPVPRWAALAAPEANLRTGPGKRYPIDWVIKKKALPVEIIQEFEHWRRVRVPDGSDGWIHKSMLTGMRKTLTSKDQELYSNPNDDARIVAKLQKNVIANLKQCHKTWCEIEVDQYDGWMKKDALWGVYKDETFD